MTNHPVHIISNDGQLMPTALIPFCSFGNKMDITGVKIDEFEVPVCNIFRPKIVKDQLCYTVNPNDFRDKLASSKILTFSFVVDMNEDRMSDGLKYSKNLNDEMSKKLMRNSIIIGTIGNFNQRFSVSKATKQSQMSFCPFVYLCVCLTVIKTP